jgi:hypothetical protein
MRANALMLSMLRGRRVEVLFMAMLPKIAIGDASQVSVQVAVDSGLHVGLHRIHDATTSEMLSSTMHGEGFARH